MKSNPVKLEPDVDREERAFQAALEQWPLDGIPRQPRAWLISTGRFKAIDRLRRESRRSICAYSSATSLLVASYCIKNLKPTFWILGELFRCRCHKF